MATKVQLVLDRVAKEPTFAQLIIKDPQVTLAPYRLSPEEINKVLTVVRTEFQTPPPP
ncbi:MAG: hypothetical protein PVH95_06395 [Anaerolineae bacterium]|jgi:hypothetical protein